MLRIVQEKRLVSLQKKNNNNNDNFLRKPHQLNLQVPTGVPLMVLIISKAKLAFATKPNQTNPKRPICLETFASNYLFCALSI